MKLRFKKAVAATMAMAMCLPTTAFAADVATGDSAKSGNLNTSFDVYAPALHISVPLNADIRVNPLVDATTAGDTVKKFGVASNSVDIINASVDTENGVAIPINVTVEAGILSTGTDVVSVYKDFTEAQGSKEKKIHLDIAEASQEAGLDITNIAASPDNAKLLDFSSVEINRDAEYAASVTNKTALTKSGALLSMDIAAPTSSGDITDPTTLTPTVGSFAITGTANTAADWKADDVKVGIRYNVKASKALNVTTPTITTAPTVTVGNDLTVKVTGIGEAKVKSVAIHNDAVNKKDVAWGETAYAVDYSTAGEATITIKAGDAIIKTVGDAVSGEAQDFIIVLSDGRVVVTTLTVTKPATP